MEYCYIGIFSSIFNWILDKILSPVFNFIAKLLSTVLSWVFNNVLAPLLEAVIWPLIKEALNLLVEILAGLLYGVYASLLEILDTLNSAFDYFIGLRDVSFNGQKMGLLEAMFEIDGLRTAFLVISLMGMSIALMLAIFSTMRSVLDLDFENKRPVSRVLSSLFRAFLQMLTVEVVVYFLIRLASLILKGVNSAVGLIGGGSGNTSIARMIFVVSSMNACSSDKNLNLNGTKAASVGINDPVRSKFYLSSGLSYTDADVVEQYFNLGKFDYVIGFALCIFLLVVMAMCMVIFVQRIFDLLMLFLVSPFFVGMIPLDDGERFGRWRELFIGKCFSGFGIVIGMKLYLMICPVIMGSSVTFSNSTEMDYLTKMVFLLGGAWAVLKSGSLVTSLLSSQAGSSEDQVINSGSMVLGGMAAGSMAMVGTGIGKGLSGIASAYKGSKQKFEDTRFRKNTGLGLEGGGSSGLSSSGGGSSSGASISGGSAGTSAAGRFGSSLPGAGRNGLGLSDASKSGSGTFDSSGSSGATGLNGSSSATGLGSGTITSGLGGSGLGAAETGGNAASPTPRSGQYVGGKLIKSYRNADGSISRAFSPGKGKLFKIGHDGKGNTNVRMLGFGLRVNSEGKINKISLPCVNLKRNDQGKMNVDRVRLPLNAASWKRNDSGQLKFRDFNLIGLKMGQNSKGKSYIRQFKPIGYRAGLDEEGNRQAESLLGLFQREKQADGKYHITSLGFGAVQNSRVMDEDGKLRFAGVRVLGMNFYIRNDVSGGQRREPEAGDKSQGQKSGTEVREKS